MTSLLGNPYLSEVGNIIQWPIWSILGAIVGWTFPHLYRWFKTRGQRKFWKPFIAGKGPLPVVLTDKAGAKPRSPAKVSITDVQAYSEVRSALADFRKVKIRAGSAVRIDELIEDSFVTLGGPKANGITEQVLQRLGGRVPVLYDQVSGAFRFKGDEFAPVYDAREFVARDYALILRLLHLDDKNSKSKAVLVVFGLHGHGTEQAVRAISDHDPLYQRISPYFGKDCWAFLRFDYTDHSCTDRTVIDAGKLN